ncbi:MAG: DNA adenine methylase [bacterium]
MKTPIAWVGGKFYQSFKIMSWLPPHNLWCEVFGGSAVLTFAKEPSKIEVYNDLNEQIVNFFLVARDHAKELVKRLDSLPYARSLFQKYKNEPLPDEPIERACRWFYILQSSYSHIYGSGWAYAKIRNHASCFRNKMPLILKVRDRFRRVMIECLDFRQIFEKYDSKDTLFFVDPPYDFQSSKENYYDRKHNRVPAFTEQDHRDLASICYNLQGKAIVCGYPTDLMKELYPTDKWIWLPYKQILYSKRECSKTKRKEIREEVLFINFELLNNLLI